MFYFSPNACLIACEKRIKFRVINIQCKTVTTALPTNW